MEAYLDNSATTRCLEQVTDLMVRVMREDYGNPSSLHTAYTGGQGIFCGQPESE